MNHLTIKIGPSTFLIDKIDLPLISQYSWCVGKDYIIANKTGPKRGTVYLHKLIMGDPINMEVDHINGDRLDNRRLNLRICTRQQNRWNRKIHRNNLSGYKGVSKNHAGWQAQIKFNKRRYHLGTFTSREDAAKEYNKFAKKFFGEFALLNKI